MKVTTRKYFPIQQTVFLMVLLVCSFSCFAQKSTADYKVTKTGLQYKLYNKTKAAAIEKNDRVYLAYTTRISDGSIVDEVAQYAFIVGQNEGLKGWDEALLLLHVGDSAGFILPPELAYGSRKVGKVPPNSTLRLNCKIVKKEKAYFNYNSFDSLVLKGGVVKYALSKGSSAIKPNGYVTIKFTGYVYTAEGNRRIFESSSSNSTEAFIQLGVGKFIKGLDEGIKTMLIGEKATFIIPPELAYGNKTNGIIPANSVLYFDIELISQTNPFFTFHSTDTLVLPNKIKLLKNKSPYTPINSFDKVVTCHCVSYYYDEKQQPIVFSNTHEGSNTPLTMRIGAKTTLSAFAFGLVYFAPSDSGLIITPPGIDFGKTKRNVITENKYIYHQIEVLAVNPYPFFETAHFDTTSLPSGLKYIQIRSYHNDSIKLSDDVQIAYTGFYIDSLGKPIIVDASRENGKLLTFKMKENAVIKGFLEGVLGMGIGDVRRLLIPFNLAYGKEGVPSAGIPPKQNLIFDIEIMNITHNLNHEDKQHEK